MSITRDTPQNDQKTASIEEPGTPDVEMKLGVLAGGDDQRKVREKTLADRASKRKERRDRNHTLAEDLSNAGDALIQVKDYAGACANYLQATNLWSSNPSNYLKLASAYFKCTLYVEATHAATRALSLDPTSLEARYLRGQARLEQRLLSAAKIDFETVLKQDPIHADAQASLFAVTVLLESGAGDPHVNGRLALPGDDTQDVDFDFPRYADDKLELASLSDSSDCNHRGNGIPCRFYNHQGCARGTDCVYSHAPDEKSVRDNLGKNVCLYFLLSSCKFGDVKCVYSHSKKELPTTQGWWNDEKRMEKVRGVLEMAEKKTKEQRALDALLHKLTSKEKKAKGGRRQAGGAGATKQAKRRSGGGKQLKRNERQDQSSAKDDTDAEEMEERMMNGGFTNEEVEELLSQGVKPWEDDARAVLDALYM